MSANNPFYVKNKLSLDVVFLSIVFQSIIVEDWLVFKKHLFNDRSQFYGTLIGLIIFVFLLFFCHEPQRIKAAQTLKKSFPHINWARPTFADAIRFVIQAMWLGTIQTKNAYNTLFFYQKLLYRLKGIVSLPFNGAIKAIGMVLSKFERSSKYYHEEFEPYVYVLFLLLLGFICFTVPFNIPAQIIFVILAGVVSIIARAIVGHLSKLILITLALAVLTRYLWWRCTSTLNIDSHIDVFLGVILICAEIYTWFILLLSYFQIAWPLQRKTVPLPDDESLWPSVDIFIPTYNEKLDIVKITTLAALSIDWPEDKLNIFILDDGKRSSFQEFAEQVNVGYITRNNNFHGKAGNINHALMITKSDYVTILECDHIPVRSFLQLTMGCFLEDEQLALIQTSHHLYSPDPFERNISDFKKTLNEDNWFNGAVQEGSDLEHVSLFRGSGAILKRESLLEVGGIAVETVNEDEHTALRLHRNGYTSAYINVIQAARLTTATLAEHIGQLILRACGMAQIFRIDNPLLGKGLSIGQRLYYVNAMAHFLGGIPRLIFLLAPLGFLFFHSYLIHAPTVEILLYAIPAFVYSSIANSYQCLHGKQRYSFWNEIYQIVLAWYITLPTAVTLISPKGSVNVLATESLIKPGFLNPPFSRPYLFLVVLNLLAIAAAAYRFLFGSTDENTMVLIYFAWTTYNLLVLGGAINMMQEKKQVRMQHRIEVNTEVMLKKASGHLICAILEDYSGSGLGLRIDMQASTIEKNEKIQVLISRGEREFSFPARVTNVNKGFFEALFENLTLQQQLDYIQCTYSRSDAWVTWNQYSTHDNALSNIKTIIAFCFHGYIGLARSLPRFITKFFLLVGTSTVFIKTLLPKNINDNSIQYENV